MTKAQYPFNVQIKGQWGCLRSSEGEMWGMDMLIN